LYCFEFNRNKTIPGTFEATTYNRFKSITFVTVIELCRFEWLWHVRVDGERRAEWLLEETPGGR
jgi:hypothetical protein